MGFAVRDRVVSRALAEVPGQGVKHRVSHRRHLVFFFQCPGQETEAQEGLGEGTAWPNGVAVGLCGLEPCQAATVLTVEAGEAPPGWLRCEASSLWASYIGHSLFFLRDEAEQSLNNIKCPFTQFGVLVPVTTGSGRCRRWGGKLVDFEGWEAWSRGSPKSQGHGRTPS